MRLFVAALIALMLSTGTSYAKKPPVVQFINIAPLPGAGIALDTEGKPDGCGAMQINIPIAYTPGAGFVNVAAYAGAYGANVRRQTIQENTNGSGVLGMGFGGWPRVYFSGMAVSSWIANDSKVLSGQLQMVRETDTMPALAIGAQDILDKERGDFGTVANARVSWYGVATKKMKLKDRYVYASLGYGAGRFLDRPFGGMSVSLNDHYSFAAEYDGFQINTGIGWRPGSRYSDVTILVGYNAKAGPLVGVQATDKNVSGAWALPILLALLRD